MFIISIINNDVSAQDEYLARSWPNGNPMVVYFLKSGTQEILKEQVFYRNGQLDYEGSYENGLEQGFWTYYWENGSMKSREFYQNGLEEGTLYDYDNLGDKQMEYIYTRGVLVSKTFVN
jgi:antitoxin component YwqK of YwqJK toxin-antitoxin module